MSVWRVSAGEMATVGQSWYPLMWKCTSFSIKESDTVLTVQGDRMLKAEVQLELENSVFWTDSSTVREYIRNETKYFHSL